MYRNIISRSSRTIRLQETGNNLQDQPWLNGLIDLLERTPGTPIGYPLTVKSRKPAELPAVLLDDRTCRTGTKCSMFISLLWY
jgi:hypothetical protein